ncbi:MAG: hypothetical protein B7Y77_02760 [Bradyrhizobium sp. 35-63-5]|nr:MAG: hypothetical protein B7Y77_02760 [Bradyrhizobium sp. 35-63-5]
MATLGKAADVGLDPTDYPTPDFAAATTAEALAAAELKLTASALTYAREAQIGRIHYTRVGGDISFKLEPQEPAKVLAKLATADDMDLTLKLGLGYPEGPIELLERTGLAAHHDVTAALHEALGNPAYAPARRAQVAKARQLRGV